MQKGYFISFEGGEGTGKSTQIKLLYKSLVNKGYDVLLTKEPGGTKIGHKIRELLLNPSHETMDARTEILLYAADRVQDLKENIKPALKAGKIVLADRYVDSNLIYQGYGRELGIKWIKKINEWVIKEYWPDLTILLDLEVKKGLKRAREVSEGDRLEQEVIEFHQRIRNGYLKMAENESRFEVFNADCSPEKLQARILETVMKKINQI